MNLSQIENLKLWRLTWSHSLCDHWLFVRNAPAGSGPYVKRLHELSDKGAYYVLSVGRPSMDGVDTSRARHVASA